MGDTTNSTDGQSSGIKTYPFNRQEAQAVLGSERLLRKVAALFLENAPNLFAEMKAAIETSDSDKLQRSAHTLVSSLAYLSAKSATNAALSLEDIGRSNELENAESAYHNLNTESERLRAALRVYLDTEEG